MKKAYKNPKSLIIKINPDDYSEKGFIEVNSKLSALNRISDLIRETNTRVLTIKLFIIALLSGIVINFLVSFLSLKYSDFIENLAPFLIGVIILVLFILIIYFFVILRRWKKETKNLWEDFNKLYFELKNKGLIKNENK